MTFKELCQARYSVRRFTDQPIDAEKLEYIMECARLAPSAVNLQPWRLRVVSDAEGLDKLCSCYKRDWIRTAPAIIIVSVDSDEAWTRSSDDKYHGDIDAAIITEHICLAAAEQGLGTCWVCNFDSYRCHDLFALPRVEEVVALIPIGTPADQPSEKNRKQMADIWL